jgi:hypothetical protein
MTRLAYSTAAITVIGWALQVSQRYVSDTSVWPVAALMLCLVLVIVLAGVALFRKQWLAAMTCFLTFVLVLLPLAGVQEPVDWLQKVRFRSHVSPVDEYLLKCRLQTIYENEKLQQIGWCESLSHRNRRIDIVYDTTGEMAWPKEKLTPEWKAAVDRVFPAGLLATPSTRNGISGNFYAVTTPTAISDGRAATAASTGQPN